MHMNKLNNLFRSGIKNVKTKAAAATALAISGIGSAHADMSFDPAASIGAAQVKYEGYADSIMTWMWIVGPTIMLGFAAWALLKKGVKSAK